MRRCPVAVLLVLALNTGPAAAETFAQHPGFAEWFRRHPPEPAIPDPADRAVLQRHRPVLFVPPDAPGPIDFYRDYIASGTMSVGGQRLHDISREDLAHHADDPTAIFRHIPPEHEPRPVAYGRVDRAALPPFGELTFLTWHFVFRHSGLPAELPVWQGWLAAAFGDREDWHQLDHYTAATLALAPDGQPLALILQHHNHLRSYWLGRDITLPADGRPRLAAAVRSNELYPRSATTRHERVVRFLDADNLAWLATGEGNKPWTGSHDRIEAGRKVDYTLEFLPQTDPFYRFHGRLGENRLLPGRDGPPGADYKTLPAFMDPTLQLCGLRWPGDDRNGEDLAALRRLLADPGDPVARTRLYRRCRRFVESRLDDPAQAIGYNAGLPQTGTDPR